MSAEHVITECAAVLSVAAAASAGALSFEDVCADLRGPQRLLQLLRFCWALRRNRRTRRPWTEVLNQVQRPVPAPFCRALLHHTYSLFNVIRSRAAPYLPRAPGRALFRGYVPRALARVLRRHGVMAFRDEDRVSLRYRAGETIRDLCVPAHRTVVR